MHDKVLSMISNLKLFCACHFITAVFLPDVYADVGSFVIDNDRNILAPSCVSEVQWS